ncbi:MAG: H-type lectin domain-containing protein [Pseudomonadota bacterium]
MQRLQSQSIGIEQGETLLFSDFQNGGKMWCGSGQREVRQRVTFSEAYLRAPNVMAHLTMWDLDKDANTRADVKAEAVERDAFDIVFRTWGDTRIARVRVGWMAIGETAGEDSWEL